MSNNIMLCYAMFILLWTTVIILLLLLVLLLLWWQYYHCSHFCLETKAKSEDNYQQDDINSRELTNMVAVYDVEGLVNIPFQMCCQVGMNFFHIV